MTAAFDPGAWLNAYADAGGHWMLTSTGPVLGYPYPAPSHLVEMREALSSDEAEAIRRHIRVNSRRREGLI